MPAACTGRAGTDAHEPNPGAVSTTIWTCGYEPHRTPQSLIDTLDRAGVEHLVDVRELPLSRRRGFSKTALGDTLRAHGIEYSHVRALGNPKPVRDLYRAGDIATGEARYRAHLRSGSAGAVDDLATMLGERRTALLCWEQDPTTCHRKVIVEELARRAADLRAVHLSA